MIRLMQVNKWIKTTLGLRDQAQQIAEDEAGEVVRQLKVTIQTARNGKLRGLLNGLIGDLKEDDEGGDGGGNRPA